MPKAGAERKKNVCFLYYQGFNQLIHREAVTLKKDGYEVDIICLKLSAEDVDFERYDGLNLYKIQSRLEAEKTLGGYVLGLSRFLVKSALLITRMNFSRRYDLIHVTSPPDFAVFTTIIPKLMGARIILDIHDIGPELFMRKLGVEENHPAIKAIKLQERVSAWYADHVITVTDIWRDRLISRKVPAEKCSVLLNVPDQNVFRFRGTRPRPGRKEFKLYYHGSLEEHFGVDTMIDAMPLIKEQIPEVVLHIYGAKKGRMYHRLTEHVARHGMEEYVKFHDGVMFDALPGILADADIGMVPTKNSTFADEAVSMKSLEYLFLGIPVVISRTTAHSFYYDDSMVRFFEPCNSGDLADAVVELYRNREKMRLQVKNSSRFLERFGWERTGRIYSGIVSGLVPAARN
jgi:glycosyltransferase involved in cell wall biosynthesis